MKKKITFDEVDINIAKDYAAEDSDVAFRLWELLKLELIKNNLYDFYFYIEKPLIEIIASMEINGCKINNKHLIDLTEEFSKKINLIEDKIFKASGEKFNVGSPKQLGEMLFSKMSLPFGKKGKSGNFQTDVKVLEKLKSEKFSIATLILEWRQFSKLKNTYCEGLLSRESKKTSRIHTSFGMASTLTGRLSSNDPNLQNIPIKTNEGRKIRKSFISSPNHIIVSLDYSQIELRILAHVANVTSLIEAFKNDQDIHSVTAIDVFQVDKNSLNSELRRKAKTINFGIIYGFLHMDLGFNLEFQILKPKNILTVIFLSILGLGIT